LVGGIDDERSRAYRSVEITSADSSERKQTNSRIISAGGEAKKSGLPFRRVSSGVAAIGRRAQRVRHRGKRKGANCKEQDCRKCDLSIFHKLFSLHQGSNEVAKRSSEIIFRKRHGA
jgi:hypothetical protein